MIENLRDPSWQIARSCRNRQRIESSLRRMIRRYSLFTKLQLPRRPFGLLCPTLRDDTPVPLLRVARTTLSCTREFPPFPRLPPVDPPFAALLPRTLNWHVPSWPSLAPSSGARRIFFSVQGRRESSDQMLNNLWNAGLSAG